VYGTAAPEVRRTLPLHPNQGLPPGTCITINETEKELLNYAIIVSIDD
jgi:hypothetical protein